MPVLGHPGLPLFSEIPLSTWGVQEMGVYQTRTNRVRLGTRDGLLPPALWGTYPLAPITWLPLRPIQGSWPYVNISHSVTPNIQVSLAWEKVRVFRLSGAHLAKDKGQREGFFGTPPCYPLATSSTRRIHDLSKGSAQPGPKAGQVSPRHTCGYH